ncbi:nicotinate-nucleotide--dimethylbenzimidazole phosphoribosyltransferase [Aedoeadaptatus acetigenes]|uniref:Nicotinate-nucleotide--dimethylbenzimidazole phosphoribosyltransferase n=1 Tax=Aedoeadaptatus acetigenes TaxID=2981723 RepID=A0ABV1J3T1_9FIRM|nr:nicotinate-nucleotide--dimethylbenzimidazole phosphoribosyltransferase [Aedoeadaptatus acetigenes]MCU6785737.1 nicotinate-nucleotide--dimethylbenzimidazole phosphoribosyltransferase [Aedoeadaptatus acetigenes]
MKDKLVGSVEAADKAFMKKAKAHWDNRTHPTGSLGALEAMTIRLAGIQRRVVPSVEKTAIVVFCADNGVVAEDVSSSPPVFTQMLANAMARGETGVAALSRRADSELFIVDMGMNEDVAREAKIIDASLRKGTGNIAEEPAMSRDEAIEAIKRGMDITKAAIKKGASMIGTGELGIGNTTTSAALLCALTGESAEDCVGYGAGITEAQLAKKVAVVKKAVARAGDGDVIHKIAQVGGLDLAGLVGAFLACAEEKTAAVVDGFVTGVAALAAIQMAPEARDYIFLSHKSAEKASALVNRHMGMEPPLDLSMRLGEGSGCPLFFQLMEGAIYAMKNMGSMEDNAIDPGLLVNIEKESL